MENGDKIKRPHAGKGACRRYRPGASGPAPVAVRRAEHRVRVEKDVVLPEDLSCTLEWDEAFERIASALASMVEILKATE